MAMVASKDMPTLPESFLKVFWHNQFQVKIDLPTRSKYPSLAGKVAVITGSNIGLGFESAKQLLGLGLSHIVLAVRSIEKGKAAASKLQPTNPTATIDVWELDMESYDSIRSFVSRCNTSLPRIDYTILNAGMSPLKFSKSLSTGHEKTIQVNFLSTILLAILLLPVLKDKSNPGSPARLTVINSVMAHTCKFPNRDKRPLLSSFDDTKITPWDPSERYGVSKLLGQLFLVELAAHVNSNNVIINMVDPGWTKGTGLARELPGPLVIVLKGVMAVAARPVDRGAATYVDALLGHGKESHGCFLMNNEIAPLATFYYTADGKKATQQIWDETVKELEFAHVKDIIASMK